MPWPRRSSGRSSRAGSSPPATARGNTVSCARATSSRSASSERGSSRCRWARSSASRSDALPVRRDQALHAEVLDDRGLGRVAPRPRSKLRLVDWIVDVLLGHPAGPLVRDTDDRRPAGSEQLAGEGAGPVEVLEDLEAEDESKRSAGSNSLKSAATVSTPARGGISL